MGREIKSGQNAPLRLYVKDRSRLVITGARGVVLTTSNAGDKWVLRPSGVRDHLFAVTFAPKNPLLGWAVGTFGSIIATTDGGKTWKPQTSQTSSHLFSIAFADAKNGIAVGAHGTILITATGGAEWKLLKKLTDFALTGV